MTPPTPLVPARQARGHSWYNHGPCSLQVLERGHSLAAYHTLLVAGVEMAGSVIAGAAIGHWIDTRWLAESGWRGAATVAGIALGFAVGVRLLLLLLARASAAEPE